MSAPDPLLEELNTIAAATAARSEDLFRVEAESLLAGAYLELGAASRSLSLACQAARKASSHSLTGPSRARILTRCAEVEVRHQTPRAGARTQDALEAIRSAERQAASSAATAEVLRRWLWLLGQHGSRALCRQLLPPARMFVEQLKPASQSLFLDICGEAWAGVGAQAWVQQRLRHVLEEAPGTPDLFGLGSAFRAWRKWNQGEGLAPELVAHLVALLRAAEPQVNPMNVHVWDEGVLVLGEPLLADLLSRASPTSEASEILLTSAALRGLATRGSPATGWRLLREALAAAWSWPELEKKRFLLGRLVESVACWDCEPEGLLLLHETLERLDRSEDEPLQGEVLGACLQAARIGGDREGILPFLEQIAARLLPRIIREDQGRFEVLSLCLENLAALGAHSTGQKIVAQVEGMFSEASSTGAPSHPYFRHRARIWCGYSRAQCGEPQAGARWLLEALQGAVESYGFEKIDLLRGVAHSLAAFPRAERRALARRILEILLSAADLEDPLRELHLQIFDQALRSLVAGESILHCALRRWEQAAERCLRERGTDNQGRN